MLAERQRLLDEQESRLRQALAAEQADKQAALKKVLRAGKPGSGDRSREVMGTGCRRGSWQCQGSTLGSR